jgi:hypothetical protein
MSTLTSLKKYWYWVALVVLSVLIASAAFVAPSKISQIELEREALVAANRLKAQMLNEPDALFYSSPARRPRRHSPKFSTSRATVTACCATSFTTATANWPSPAAWRD